MSELRIVVRDIELRATLHPDRAPRSIEALRTILPLEGHLLQGRWSGESGWVPLGKLDLGVRYENQTSHPAPGELLLYTNPEGLSETEILFPYGPTFFGSRNGQLAGNHFATVDAPRATLTEIGRRLLWEGAQPITFEEV